jgi:hypothetical protein
MSLIGETQQFEDEQFALRASLLEGWSFGLWMGRQILDRLWWWRMESRTVFLPATVVRKLREQVVAAMKRVEEDEVSFVSDGDIVTAWINCQGLSALPSNSRRSVTFVQALDIRDRMPSLFSTKTSSDGSYLQNAISFYYTILPVREALAGSTAFTQVATSFRKSLEAQTTEGQIHALARLCRSSIQRYSMIPIFGDIGGAVLMTSNWSKAKIYETADFEPAVVSEQQGEKSKKVGFNYHESSLTSTSGSKKGRPVFYQALDLSPNAAGSRNCFLIGKTPEGHYWIDGMLPPSVWSKIKYELSTLE